MGASEIGDPSPQPSNQTETVSMQWQATDQSMHSSGSSLNRLTQPTPSVHKPVHAAHRSNYMHPIRSGRGGPPPPPRQSGPPRSRRYRPPCLRGEEPPTKRHPWTAHSRRNISCIYMNDFTVGKSIYFLQPSEISPTLWK